MESPYPMRKFELEHNVENLILGDFSSAVIVEDRPGRKKKNKKPRRSISMEDVRENQMQLKADNEARMAAVLKQETDEEAKPTRVPLSERMRGHFHKLIYGDDS